MTEQSDEFNGSGEARHAPEGVAHRPPKPQNASGKQRRTSKSTKQAAAARREKRRDKQRTGWHLVPTESECQHEKKGWSCLHDAVLAVLAAKMLGVGGSVTQLQLYEQAPRNKT